MNGVFQRENLATLDELQAAPRVRTRSPAEEFPKAAYVDCRQAYRQVFSSQLVRPQRTLDSACSIHVARGMTTLAQVLTSDLYEQRARGCSQRSESGLDGTGILISRVPNQEGTR